MTDRHGVVVVAADAVDAGDVAHQLARGDRPLLFRIRGNIALNRRIEIESPPLVQKGGGDRGQWLRESAETEARERRDRRPAIHVGPAETFGPHDLAVHRDGHRQARQVVPSDQCAREPSGLLDGTGYRSGGATATVDDTGAAFS